MDGGSEVPGGDGPQGVCEVTLTFDTMRQLQAELAPNLSTDGLFLPSKRPLAVDTVVRFRVSLPEEFVLIEGTGVVIWNRRPGDDRGPAGMAIRYVSLSREAQETIDAVIDAHLATGGELFDLEPEAADGSAIPTDALESGAREAAREATARQIEHARLTIRDLTEAAGLAEEESRPAEGFATIDDDYLSSVEAEVEEAVASIRLRDAEPEPIEMGGHLADEDVAGAGKEPGSAGGAPAPDELAETVEGLEYTELVPDEEVVDELELVAEPVPTPSEETGPRAGPEAIETLIPVFLERWKEEIGSEVEPVAGDRGRREDRLEPTERGVAEPTPQEEGAVPAVPVVEPALRAGERMSAEMSELPASEFEVSVIEPDALAEETPAWREERTEDDSVTLAPAEERTGGGRRWLYLAPLLLAPVIGVGGYLGWQWYQGRTEAPPARLTAPARVAEEPAAEPGAQPETAEPQAAVVEPEEAPAASRTQPEEAPSAVTHVAEEPVSAEPASVVEDIEWRTGGGTTEVMIRGNGVISEDRVSVFPMRDPDRILVRLRHIRSSYPQYEIPVGSPEVVRIRTGHHPEMAPPALYVVLDLANPLVGLVDLSFEGDTVLVAVAAQ